MYKKKNILSSFLFTGMVTASLFSTARADNQGTAHNIYTAPIAVLGAASGIVIGTPIAITRLSGKSMVAIFHQYDNDTFSWKLWGRPCALPLGIVEGTIKGCVKGPKNAIRYAKDKPFSKDSFSLEDLN